jgi:hypothetical protein
MATIRKFVCSKCETKTNAGSLFNALRSIANKQHPKCANGHDAKLHLTFPFGLGIGLAPCTVQAAYLPNRAPNWKNGRYKVQYFPFLVVVKFDDSKLLGFWMPYWHVEHRPKKYVKYGQWAPQMEAGLFIDLVEKVKADGFLKRQKLRRGHWA